jgi:hypothetical protein
MHINFYSIQYATKYERNLVSVIKRKTYAPTCIHVGINNTEAEVVPGGQLSLEKEISNRQ